MYGSASGASVSDLFIAGIIPGLLIGFLLMVYAYIYCKKHGEDQERKMKMVNELKGRGFLSVLKDSSLALLSPVIILGCIYSGIASPTEAAVISVFYALIISLFVYRSIKIKDIWSILVESIRTYTPILFILAASIAFSRVLTLMQVPQAVSDWILTHFTNPSAGDQCLPSDRRHGHGHHTSHSDPDSDPAADRNRHRHESDSFWCYDGRQSCNRFCHTAHWCKLICCFFSV